MPNHLIILKAKNSEFKAIKNSTDDVLRQLFPLFEIGRLPADRSKWPKWLANENYPVAAYLDRVVGSIVEAWGSRTMMIDADQWRPDSQTEHGAPVVRYAVNGLIDARVPVVPIVGYDRWENVTYKNGILEIQRPEDGRYFIRLNAHAIEDIADPDFFDQNIGEMIDDLSLVPEDCGALIDFGDVSAIGVASLVEKTEAVLRRLDSFGFGEVATAGCSIPSTIDLAVKSKDSCQTITRREMQLWKVLRPNHANLMFGDYGVRGPNTNDGQPSPNTNGKIRYTINNSTFIARGHSLAQDGHGEQMYDLAEAVAQSGHYMGPAFSWGDEQLRGCRRRQFMGNAGTWIAIDTNHHLTHVMHELAEFERNFRLVRTV